MVIGRVTFRRLRQLQVAPNYFISDLEVEYTLRKGYGKQLGFCCHSEDGVRMNACPLLYQPLERGKYLMPWSVNAASIDCRSKQSVKILNIFASWEVTERLGRMTRTRVAGRSIS